MSAYQIRNMETIIGLLFILLPLIFKLIGKKLEQSGKSEAAGKVREFAEMFGGGDDNESAGPDVDSTPFEPVPPFEPEQPFVRQPEPVAEEVVENVTRQVGVKKPEPKKPEPKKAQARRPEKKKPILVEEEPKKGEKIDPKKLVIYSEIMKPKYTE